MTTRLKNHAKAFDRPRRLGAALLTAAATAGVARGTAGHLKVYYDPRVR